MTRALITTLHRDINNLTKRSFSWYFLAIWCFCCAIIFFAYLDDFLAIQPKLRAKNFSYGVSDVLIIPYIKMLSSAALIFTIGFCAKLFFYEHFSNFSPFIRATQASALSLWIAKLTFIAMLAAVFVALLASPILVSSFFAHYHFKRLIVALLGQYMLLFSAGIVSAICSQIFRYSSLVILLTAIFFILPELLTRLISEPVWLTPIVAYFSAISHANHMAMGIISLSDIVFFLTLWLSCSFIAIRQFENTYLTP